jgi:probable HAF family extracellular repeat protein
MWAARISSIITAAAIFHGALFCRSAEAQINYAITDLGVNLTPLAISANGKVTGDARFNSSSVDHTFLYDGSLHDLDPVGTVTNYGNSVNSSGQVTGVFTQVGLAQVLFYDGAMHHLGTLGGTVGVGTSINENGVITGYASLAGDSVTHAFIYDGTFHDIGTLFPSDTRSTSVFITNSRTVFGTSVGPAGILHGFRYDGTMHDLGVLRMDDVGITAANSNGYFVGDTTFVGHAYLFDGTPHDLGLLPGPGFVASDAHDINTAGAVVGTRMSVFLFQPGGVNFNDRRPFLYTSAAGKVDLNTRIDPSLGWTLLEAEAINDAGQIAGYGYFNGNFHAYVLTPIPEPGGIALAAIGSACLVFRFSRERFRRRG